MHFLHVYLESIYIAYTPDLIVSIYFFQHCIVLHRCITHNAHPLRDLGARFLRFFTTKLLGLSSTKAFRLILESLLTFPALLYAL